MRAVVQRVLTAKVEVGEEIVGQIGPGLLVLVGVSTEDTEADATQLAEKIATLRVFGAEGEEDGAGEGMERSVLDTGKSVLLVSQFTLMGDCRKGRRPSWMHAARPEEANRLFEIVVEGMVKQGVHTQKGRFRTHMHVSLINDGPVTILLDTKKVF
jgi:D-aminoacyl-tRNA deacylase